MFGWITDLGDPWFQRHGPLAVTLGRLVPGVRALISVPAGIAGMRVLPFLFCTIVGTALWTGALTYAGYLLGARYRRVTSAMDVATWVVLGVMVAAYLILIRLVRVRRKASASG